MDELTRVYRMDNGLRVVVRPDQSIPIVSVCVWYDVGARDEPVARTGLAHLFEHLMFEGAANVAPNEHVEYVQGVGGSANGDTTHEATFFLETVPAHHLQPVLWLEAERMAGVGRSLTRERLDNQRAVVIHERRQRYDGNQVALAWEQVVAHTHPEGHPFRHMPAGAVADLERISLEDALQFARRYYTPTNAVLCIVGDVQEDQVLFWVERHFGAVWAADPGHRRATLPVRLPAALPVLRRPGGEPALLAAYRLPPEDHPDGAAVAVAMSILGSGMRARLRRGLVELAQLAQRATFGSMTLARSPSMGLLEVQPANRATLRDVDAAVADSLDAFAVDGPDELDLELAKQKLRRRHMDDTATTGGLAVALARSVALHADVAWDGTRLDRIAKVSGDDVRRVTRRYLCTDNRATMTIGPAISTGDDRAWPT